MSTKKSSKKRKASSKKVTRSVRTRSSQEQSDSPEMALPKSVLAFISKTYQRHANRTQAVSAKKYMRNQFEFYGLKTPQRRLLDKESFDAPLTETKHAESKETDYIIPREPSAKDLDSIVRLFWEQPHRELQYFAQEYTKKHIKRMPAEFLDTLKFSIVTKSWWDTVDMQASLVGTLVLLHPQLLPEMNKWVEDENKWLKRSAIIFQLKYKEKTDEELLYQFCLKNASHEDFFIRKAIGWALREYSKTNPKSVKKFVSLNKGKLSPLSIKEALRRIKS